MKYISLFNILIPLALMTNAGAFNFSDPKLTYEAKLIDEIKRDDQGNFPPLDALSKKLPWITYKEVRKLIKFLSINEQAGEGCIKTSSLREVHKIHDDAYISNRAKDIIVKHFNNEKYNDFWKNTMQADKQTFSKNGGVFILSATQNPTEKSMSGYALNVHGDTNGYTSVVIIYPTPHKDADAIDSTIVHELTHVVFNDSLDTKYFQNRIDKFNFRTAVTESLSLYSQVIFDRIKISVNKSYLPDDVTKRIVPDAYSMYFALMTKIKDGQIVYNDKRLELLLNFIKNQQIKQTHQATTRHADGLIRDAKRILGGDGNNNLGEFEKAFSNSMTAQLGMQTSEIFNKGTTIADMLNADAKERHTPRGEKEIFSTQPQILEASLQRIGADIYTNFAD